MERNEQIAALRRCGDEPYDITKPCKVSPWKLMRDAADALEADEQRIDGLQKLVDLNTQRCEALRKQLRKAHENYEKHLNELEAQLPKWTSVEDHLPEESKEYIVYIQVGTGVEVPDYFGNDDLSYVTSMYFKKEQKLWFDEYDEPYNADLSLVDTVNDYHVTHWMPFSQKPKGEQE